MENQEYHIVHELHKHGYLAIDIKHKGIWSYTMSFPLFITCRVSDFGILEYLNFVFRHIFCHIASKLWLASYNRWMEPEYYPPEYLAKTVA